MLISRHDLMKTTALAAPFAAILVLTRGQSCDGSAPESCGPNLADASGDGPGVEPRLIEARPMDKEQVDSRLASLTVVANNQRGARWLS